MRASGSAPIREVADAIVADISSVRLDFEQAGYLAASRRINPAP